MTIPSQMPVQNIYIRMDANGSQNYDIRYDDGEWQDLNEAIELRNDPAVKQIYHFMGDNWYRWGVTGNGAGPVSLEVFNTFSPVNAQIPIGSEQGIDVPYISHTAEGDRTYEMFYLVLGPEDRALNLKLETEYTPPQQIEPKPDEPWWKFW